MMKRDKTRIKKIQRKKEKETVYAFIDSQNLNLGAEKSGWRLDFKRFRTYLRTKYNVTKAFLFIGLVPENQKLYDFLEKVGFIMVFKPTTKIVNKKVETYKGNVDAELVLHALLQFSKYDKAVIASGDGDFFCLIEYLESKDKLLKILTPNDKYSSLIKSYAKYILSLKKIKKKVERVKKEKERHSRG